MLGRTGIITADPCEIIGCSMREKCVTGTVSALPFRFYLSDFISCVRTWRRDRALRDYKSNGLNASEGSLDLVPALQLPSFHHVDDEYPYSTGSQSSSKGIIHQMIDPPNHPRHATKLSEAKVLMDYKIIVLIEHSFEFLRAIIPSALLWTMMQMTGVECRIEKVRYECSG